MSEQSFPWPGFVLAVLACVALLVAGVSQLIVLALLLVWLGSLYLVTANPPGPLEKQDASPFTSARMGDLIEHSGVPVVVTEGSRVAIANMEARRLFGTHIVGQDIRMLLRHPDAIRLVEQEGTGSSVVRGLVRRKDIWRINWKAVGNGLGVVEFVNRTAEADISRAHTDFVANASHELRTPLASIIGYVETLQEDDDALESDTSRKFLRTIHREAQRLQNLVSDLMSLSRIEAEKHDQPTKVVDFGTLVKRAAREGAGPEREQRLDIQTNGKFMVRGDEKQLEQLVRNLIDNALKYGDPAEKVTVRVHPNGRTRLRFTVRDRGEGISPEHLPHLTRRFYRTDPGRSRASGGTGLGLAIVKHIVERHQGRLDIESQLGEGTTVSVRLPVETSLDDRNDDQAV